MIYEWDEYKNTLNFLKHGITFNEAVSVFKTTFVVIYDKDHSTGYEDRFWAIGKIKKHGLTVVVYTERTENTIRLISARKATRTEVTEYEKA